MKDPIHPKYYEKAKVICSSCGTTFTTGSTLPELHIEICSNCHPFYTGKHTIMDTRGRVDRYKRRLEKKSTATSRKIRATAKAES